MAGCQDLQAEAVEPIPFRGKIFATYLPDGRRYTKLRPPSAPDYWEIGVLDLDKPGSKIRRLTNDLVHDAEVRVSPDHTKLLWSVRPALDLFDGDNTIVMADLDGSNRKVIAHGANKYLGIPGFFKPNGNKIFFSSKGEGDEVSKLVVIDLRTQAQSVFRTSFPGSINDPQVSPDGKKIVFKSGDEEDEDKVHIFIMNADGTGVKQLTFGEYRDEDPIVSPDGRTVAFERMYGVTEHKGQKPEDFYFKEGIVAVDLATGKETMLTEPDPCGKNELWLPIWSPDGEYIMFTRGLHLENGDFTHDLWVMRKDGSDLQRVPNSEGIMFFDWVY